MSQEKREAAVEIGNEIGGRRTYSGTLKWWRGKQNDLDWRVQLKTDDNTLDVQVRPRNVPPGDGPTFDISATDFPTFTGDKEIEYESASQFVSDVTDAAKDKLEEQVLREAIRRKLSSLLL